MGLHVPCDGDAYPVRTGHQLTVLVTILRVLISTNTRQICHRPVEFTRYRQPRTDVLGVFGRICQRGGQRLQPHRLEELQSKDVT